MSRNIPIIKIFDNLLVSIQIELSDHLVSELKNNVCDEIQRIGPRGLVIEVSGVDILDSYIARSIRDLAQMANLMGVKSVIAGLDPSMAITLVEMGMILEDVETALNLETALSMLKQWDAEEDREAQEIFDDEDISEDIVEL